MGSPWLALASRMACMFSFSRFSCCWFHLPRGVCACGSAHACSGSGGRGWVLLKPNPILRGPRWPRTIQAYLGQLYLPTLRAPPHWANPPPTGLWPTLPQVKDSNAMTPPDPVFSGLTLWSPYRAAQSCAGPALARQPRPAAAAPCRPCLRNGPRA